MGDISAEPSMEEILSSIKRIIAEEGEGTPARPRRAPRAPVMLDQRQPPEREEVLELSDPMPQPRIESAPRTEPPVAPPPAARAPEPVPVAPPGKTAEPPRTADPIVSQAAAAASRGSLDALTRAVVRPEGSAPAPASPPSADATLEGTVREMLRPMLRDWLDAHLPAIVEAMVAREIDRITGSR